MSGLRAETRAEFTKEFLQPFGSKLPVSVGIDGRVSSDKVSVGSVEEALFVAHARICGRNKRF